MLAALAPFSGHALDIVINPGQTLQGNAAALAAFNRAEERWESIFSDPITVTIDADLVSLANPNTIAQAGSVLLFDWHDFTRSVMQLDALDEPDNGIVAHIPSESQFSAALPGGASLYVNMEGHHELGFTKANGKAMGYDAVLAFYSIPSLDTIFGATDAVIEFNSNFSFDCDNSDGVGPGLMDFETVAAHEIGHSLGFVSAVDDVDYYEAGEFSPYVLDLFRFGPDSNPSDASEFTLFPRNLTPGDVGFFDDLASEVLFSTGFFNGDGRQASHWKDNLGLGIMDPTLSLQQISPITANDIRALDLIGWDLQVVPEPSTYAAGAFVLLALGGGWWRSRRQC